MNREQAINYLFSRGFTNEQVGEVVRALTYEPARLSVDEVTALAEWISKLTEECEVAYNKGYADGMKAQEPKTGHWKAKSFHELFCDNCGFDFDIMRNDFIDKMNFCPNCGADMREVEE